MLYANAFAYMIGILTKEGYNLVLCRNEIKCKYQCFPVIVGDICVNSMQYMGNYYAVTCFSEPYMVKYLCWCSSATECLDKSFQIQDENVVMGILIVEEKKVHCKGFVWLFGNVNHHQTYSLDSLNKTDS